MTDNTFTQGIEGPAVDAQGNLYAVNLLEANMGTTNGVEVSADEKYLYVNESVQRKVWKYDIDKKPVM